MSNNNNDTTKDLVYRAALTCTHEELAGMYSIALKREQEKDSEISKLKENNNYLLELSYWTIASLDISRCIPANHKLILSSFKKKPDFFKPTEKPKTDKEEMNLLKIELGKTRVYLNRLSTHNKTKKKELKFIEENIYASRKFNFIDYDSVLRKHVSNVRNDLNHTAGLISENIKKILHLKVEISNLYRKGDN